MFKRLLSVGGFTLLSRLTGFIRDVLMAAILGKGLLSDAFLFAFLFPNYFRAIFGEGTINPAFLPRYAALHAKGEHAQAARFANAVFSWQLAAQIVLLVLATLFMPAIIHVLAPGWSGRAPRSSSLRSALVAASGTRRRSRRDARWRPGLPARAPGRPSDGRVHRR